MIVGLLIITSANGQIKIGENPQNLDPASVLELESTSRALVITRVTDTQMNNIVPLRGALVYNTDQECIHYYNGIGWVNICEALDNSFTTTTEAIVNTASEDNTIAITQVDDNYNFEVNQIRGENVVPRTLFGSNLAIESITDQELQNGSVTRAKLAEGSTGISGELLRWDGAVWTLTNENSLNISEVDGEIGNEVTGPADGTLELSGGGITGNPFLLDVSPDGITNAELADNAVTSNNIFDGTILDADIAAAAAVQGTKIAPDFGAQNVSTTGTLNSGSATIAGTISSTGTATVGANTITNIDGANGQVLTTDGAGNATWQNTSSAAVQTTTAIDGNGLAATPLDLADNAVTSVKIADGAILDADIAAAAAVQGTKIAPDFGAQNVSTTGTLNSGSATIAGTISSTGTATVGANTITNIDGANGQVLTTDGAGNATWQNTSSAAVQTTTAIDGNGLAATPLDLADNAVTSVKIADGAILDADIAAAAAVQGTKIAPDFGAQNVSTTGTLNSGSATIAGTISSTGTATVGANTITNIDGANGQVLTTDGAGNATWQNTSSAAVQTTTAIDGNGLAATPLDLADNAVTSVKIADGAILDADIAAAAAVQGTKIAPDFGAQNVSTTGTLNSGSATIAGTISSTGTATVGANTITNIDGANGQVLTTDGAGNATWQNTSSSTVQTTTAIDGNGLAATPLDLADNAVTLPKIADGTAAGQLMQWDGINWVLIDDGALDVTDEIVFKGRVLAASGVTGAYTINDPTITATSIIQLTVEENPSGNPIIIQLTNQGLGTFSVQINEFTGPGFTEINANWQYIVVNP
ncbi:Glycoprotein gp2 [Flagellimonas maritima]|uniref:Glycoprotein gp2 n=1 Tax=Flagellimonas maritima TaxID=1383885 RepID=A0A2Z4LTZ0_9FLAO|nr:Glycoprotein gp2 [Allomuricauda aurantiaca]